MGDRCAYCGGELTVPPAHWINPRTWGRNWEHVDAAASFECADIRGDEPIVTVDGR